MTLSPASQPLNIGNVVSVGIQLYRTHFRQYIKIAGIATLWIIVPLLALIPIGVFYGVVQNYYSTLALVIPAWIVFLLYCLGRYLASSAAISRLAFGELTQQPEPEKSAMRFTNSRAWRFIVLSVLLGLLFLGIFLGLYIILVIVAIGAIGATGNFAIFQDPAATPSVGSIVTISIIGLLVLLLFLLVLGWFSARYAVADMPLAIESEATATGSIGQSWQLTKHHVWRVLLILFITFLITLPLQLLAQFSSTLVSGALSVLFPTESDLFAILEAVGVLLTFVLSFVIGIVLLPLWQSIKAVLYYDLRSRRQGLGLRLQDVPPSP